MIVDFDSLHLWLVLASSFSLSFAHCGGMCGSIVIAYASIKSASQEPKISKNFQNPQPHQNLQQPQQSQNPHDFPKSTLSLRALLGHIAYNLGRLFSYICIGIVFAFLGEGLGVNMLVRDFGGIVVGILLVVYALCFGFFPKVLRYLEPNLSKAGIFGRVFGRLLFSPSLASFFVLGILSGFLPCGLVYFFALNALNAGLEGAQAIFSSVVIMLVFWLGTLPLMLGLGVLGSGVRAFGKYKNIFFKISFLLMLSVGLLTIYKGFIMISKIF